MFMPNDVYLQGSERIRILWSDSKVIFWINIDDTKALPKLTKRADFEHLMANGELELTIDPYLKFSINPPKSGSKSEEVQKRAWDAIEDIVNREPEIYKRDSRGALLAVVLKKSGATKQTVYRWLRRYWQFGKCENALSGRYDLCGGAGKSKTLGNKKFGAPRTRTPGTGINVDDQVKNLFRVTIEKCLQNKDGYEFDYAYNQVLIAYGVKLPCEPKDLMNVPTERQFRYFYEKEFSPMEITKKTKGEILYQKDFRPVLGTSTAEVAGPGSRYQIDATIADVYLVSEQNREKIIGRPTLYFVVDVFSRAIVGMYVGLENASWVSAMEALANAVLGKVEYCKNFDIDITEDMWPTVGLPEVIIGDRGEILGRHIEILSKSFNVDIENTPPYRADWKGIVERYFRTVQVKMKPFVEGYVTKSAIGKKRHGNDYRQDGIHTLREFTQMIIRIVLFYNNEHTISTYDPDQDIPSDMPFNPILLWSWGIENRTGRLRRPPAELVKVNLLPHTEATVTEHGLKLFGCYFSCKEALEWGWFEGNYKGPKKVTVAYELYTSNYIYVRTHDTYQDFIKANLTIKSRAYKDLTIWEVWDKNNVKAEVAASSKLKQRAGSVNLVNELEKIALDSKRDTPKKSTKKSVKGITENKRQERQYERNKRIVKDPAPEDSISNNVTKLFKTSKNKKSFKLPTNLHDLLKEDQSDD